MTAGTAAGCSESGLTDGKDAVQLALTPSDGTGALRPDSAIGIAAQHGTIEDVTVSTKGNDVEGELSADRSHWKSRWTLDPGAKYKVTVTALGKDGKTQTVSSHFTTAKVKSSQKLESAVEAPDPKETVGVGMPIILNFEREVADKAAVERALEVRSSKPVEGAWHWFSNQRVVFRPMKYWPRHTNVSLRAHLSGVRAAKSLYGTGNELLNFRVGDEHIVKASAKSHQMYVKKNGKTVRHIPVSMGMGGVTKYTTTDGNHLTMDKEDVVVMDSSTVGCGPGCPGYYKETVYSAVRISDSGEYVHSAPWSVGSQGYDNVSHGCVNASPSNARWFLNFAYRGDPVKITGTSRILEPDNGWGFWQMNWKDWVKGSALKQTMMSGPQGMTPAPAAPAVPPAPVAPSPSASTSKSPATNTAPDAPGQKPEAG
ncbi:L,D-transpeptidase [Actinomadura barringtoniae]|uniref:L,D-transpeptidase n=1 Tax=Actinomadura barringtoniae TaxID=1427535 RepID=UPI001FB600D7|nr:Ig-like domain-containing protein [Actinomadura barringtoniae]